MLDHVVAIDRLSGLPYILGENKEQRDILKAANGKNTNVDI